jgi:hypothetical protein
MKKAAMILNFLFILCYSIFAQVKKGDEITYISPKADLYLKVSGNGHADTVKSYIKALLISKGYNLINEAKYSELSKEYFRNMLQQNDANTGAGETALAMLTSGSIVINRLEIDFNVNNEDSSSLKANYFSWQIFPTPPNTGKYIFEKKIVDKEFLTKHDIFEVAQMLISVITTEPEPESKKKKKEKG